jgi:small subunit ribosomal protein S6
MNFYELVFVVRQDMSYADLDKVTESLLEIVKNYDGKVLVNEYWGLKNLSYEISNNKKGHYVFLGLEISIDCRNELERRIKLSEHIIRHLVLRVEQLAATPAQMLKDSSSEIRAINVTI